MKKSFIFGATALALTASLTAPVTAHAATKSCPTYIYSSAIDGKLCDELFSQLRDTLKNCEIKYDAVILNGNCIQIPSDGTAKPDKPEDNANLSFAKQVVELVNKERAKAGVIYRRSGEKYRLRAADAGSGCQRMDEQ